MENPAADAVSEKPKTGPPPLPVREKVVVGATELEREQLPEDMILQEKVKTIIWDLDQFVFSPEVPPEERKHLLLLLLRMTEDQALASQVLHGVRFFRGSRAYRKPLSVQLDELVRQGRQKELFDGIRSVQDMFVVPSIDQNEREQINERYKQKLAEAVNDLDEYIARSGIDINERSQILPGIWKMKEPSYADGLLSRVLRLERPQKDDPEVFAVWRMTLMHGLDWSLANPTQRTAFLEKVWESLAKMEDSERMEIDQALEFVEKGEAGLVASGQAKFEEKSARKAKMV